MPSGADINAWARLLPQAGQVYGPDPLLMEKLRAAQQERQGANAFAQMFQNPGNLQNGLPTDDAMARLGAVPGAQQQYLSLLETRARLQQHQQANLINQQKLAQGWNDQSTDAMTPLLGVYDSEAGTIGKDAALNNYKTSRMAKIDEMEKSGQYPPQFITRL